MLDFGNFVETVCMIDSIFCRIGSKEVLESLMPNERMIESIF